MAIENSHREEQVAAIAGAPATMIGATDLSRNVEAAAGIGFGKAVAQGSADKGIVPLLTASNRFVGITLLDRSATGVPGNPDAFPQYSMARVRRKGDVWVVAAVAVAAGDPVYVTSVGDFTNVEGGNTLIERARWETSTAANGRLAVIRLD